MRPFPFTIGADPELNFISQGRKVDACYTMRNLLKNDEKFSTNRGLVIDGAGDIGWDGCTSTGELRPNPSVSPKKLTENIGTLFKEFYNRINLFDMSTLSFHSSIGGHLHFLLPSTKPTDTTIRKWHRIMASFYLPIMMGENKINLELRAKGNYGKISDYHANNEFTQEDGSKIKTYEFRVPSAEWITHPKICESVIAYMGVVWNEITNNSRSVNKHKELIYKTEKQGEALQQLLVSEYTSLTKNIFKDIQKAIKTFEYYEDYKDQIEYVLDIDQVMKDKKKVNYNIVEGWNLAPTKKTTKRDILSTKKFTEKSLEKNLDEKSRLINISYNSDPNCEIFANTLAQRSVAFNWKLNKTYFLFGLRKGINKLMSFNLKSMPITGQEIIETSEDFEAVSQLYRKMIDRYSANNRGRSPIRFDFNTGEIIQEKENTILIGIPYEMRMKQETKDFIDLVYDIETDSKKPTMWSQHPTVDDNNFPEEQKGKFWKVMNGKTEEVIMAENTETAAKNVAELIEERIALQREEQENPLYKTWPNSYDTHEKYIEGYRAYLNNAAIDLGLITRPTEGEAIS